MEINQNDNLHVSHLIDIAYEVAKDKYPDSFFSFHAIWSKVWKSAERFSREKVEDWIGIFYAELLLDPRFVIFNFNKWRLKENLPFEEVKKLEKTVFNEDSVFEEEYEAYVIDRKKKQEVEVVPEDSLRMDMDGPGELESIIEEQHQHAPTTSSDDEDNFNNYDL